MSPALRIQHLNKHFANGKHALRDINLSIQPGEMVALIGASGVLPVVFSRDEDLTRSRIPFSLALPAVLTAALSLALGLGAQGLWLVSDTATQGLTDTHAYVEAVIGR